MAKGMKLIALVTTVCSLLSAALYACAGFGAALTLAITFGTTAYHFLMRLLVGYTINMICDNRIDYRGMWFRVSYFEQKLYRKLKVKKWKGQMATFDPDCFDPALHTWDEIAQATCQAELVHEVIMVLSFVPIFASIPFGTLGVFVVTSVLAACYDGMFVIMQRYNRPRLIKLIEKQNNPK